MGYDRDSYVCVYLTRIVCVWRVRLSHFHQCTTGLTVIPMSIFIYIHEPLHGSAYAHYCTHTRTYGGVGFRNESVSQLRKLPQLFHPHTYAYLRLPTPTYALPTLHLSHLSHPHPTNPSKPLILPHSHYVLTTFLPTYAYSPTHTHII